MFGESIISWNSLFLIYVQENSEKGKTMCVYYLLYKPLQKQKMELDVWIKAFKMDLINNYFGNFRGCVIKLLA